MFKKSNNPDDEFSFDTGGDEMFPMEDFGSDTTKPPKGVKGYLKNVARSVKNIGVKAFKTTLPSVDSLVDSLKIDADDLGVSNIKAMLSQSKSKAKEYMNSGKDMVKDAMNDAKTRAKTGYFFKSEDDDMSMDMDFGDDFGDVSFGDSDSEDAGASVQYAKVAMGSAKAGVRASIRSGRMMANATLGAAQASIKAENIMFAQQTMLSQEQHRQKMAVMKNIATNVGKLIKQNNISIKAQMEYSLKSLAFAQDTAAMIKEIRNAQWKMTTSKELEADKPNSYNKIYGNGMFNNTQFIKNFTNKFKDNAFGGAIGSMFDAKELMGSMGGMIPGMTNGSMIASMIKDSLFEGALNASTSSKFKGLTNRFNRQAEGLPGAFNRVLGSLSDGTIKTPEFMKKHPSMMNMVRTMAGYGYESDMKNTNRNKYALGNPEEVHPFDNKAHKTLTEVIPKYLARIDAGVNNTEETYFDYKSNTLKTAKSLNEHIKAERDAVLTYSEGYSEASTATQDYISSQIGKYSSSSGLTGSDGKANMSLIKKCNKILFENLMSMNRRLGKDELNSMTNPDSSLNYDLKQNLPLDDEADVQQMISQFVEGLRRLAKDDPKAYEELQISMSSYANKYSQANYEIEDEMGRFGSSILYNQYTQDEQIEHDLKENARRQRKATNRYQKSSDLIKDSTIAKNAINKQQFNEMEKYRKEAKDLNKLKNGHVNAVIGSYGDSSSDWQINELSNQSTNGLVKNIYNLLLDGIVTYPSKGGMSKSVMSRYSSRYKNRDDAVSKYNDNLASEQAVLQEYNENAEADAKNRLYNKNFYRNNFGETDRADILERMPLIGPLLRAGGGVAEGALGFLTALTGQKFYGIDTESGNATVSAGMNKIKGFGASVKNKATGFKTDTTNKAKAIKQYSDTFAANVKSHDIKYALAQAQSDLSKYKVGGKISEADLLKEYKRSGLLGMLGIGARQASDMIKSSSTFKFVSSEMKKMPGFLKGEASALDEKYGVSSKYNKVASAIKGKFSNNPDGREEGSIIDQELDKKEATEKKEKKEQINLFKKMAGFLGLMKKDGIELGKKTQKKMDENNDTLAGKLDEATQAAAGGWSGKFNSFIDKTGLGGTGVGQALKSAATGLNVGTNIIGKTGVGKKVISGATTALFGKAAAKTVANTVTGAGASVAKGAVGATGPAGGLVGKASELIKKICEGIFKNPKVAGSVGKKAGGNIISSILKGVKQLAGKLTAKLASLLGCSATLIPIIAAAVAGFVNGTVNAKRSFGVGKGMNITPWMRISSGLAEALNGALMGIPGLICRLFGFDTVAAWIYSLTANAEEKEAIARYKKFNSMRAVLFGIDDAEKLIQYENRNVGSTIVQGALFALTAGMAKGTTEKEAAVLGFKSVEIYKYWKENKYTPLDNLRSKVAEEFGGLEAVEKFSTFTNGASKNVNEDGTVDDVNDPVKAEQQFQAINNQQNYRKAYINACKKYVLDHDLAWLTTHCTIESFKKHTGQNASEMLSGKDRAIRTLKNVGTAALMVANPLLGMAVLGARLGVNKKVQDFTMKVLNIKKDNGGKGTTTQKGFDAANADIDKTLSDKSKTNIGPILQVMRQVFTNKKVREHPGISMSYPVCVKVMNIVGKYADSDTDFANKLMRMGSIYANGGSQKGLIAQGVSSFEEGTIDPEGILGTSVPKEMLSDAVRITSGLVNMFNKMLPDADMACQTIKNKTLKLMIYEFFISGAVKANDYDDFFIKKAKILGIETSCMKRYEEKLYGNSYGIFHKLANWSINGDAADATICGFADMRVFKYWRDFKYNPIRKLEKSIASTFSSRLDDLLSDSSENPKEQAKFRKKFLQEAQKFVKTKALDWLTSKTTYEEYIKRKNDGTLQSEEAYVDPVTGAKVEGEKASLWDNIKAVVGIEKTDKTEKVFADKNNNNFRLLGAPNKADLESEDTATLAKKIAEEYHYNDNNAKVIASATTTIQNHFKSIEPNFYGDMKSANNKALDGTVAVDGGVYNQKGGPGAGSTNQGLITRDNAVGTVPKSNERNTKTNTYYDMSGNTPRSQVMNSIVTDFAENFGKELNQKLNILQEIQRENVRHNAVSEEFFIATLKMLSTIASKTGSSMSSSIDSMVDMVTR